MWSLGVLVLAMVSYFPNETSHKLRNDFAIAMHEEKMPFVWFIVDSLVSYNLARHVSMHMMLGGILATSISVGEEWRRRPEAVC